MKNEFLTEHRLSEKIKHVCKGKNLRVAVAFIGIGADTHLFNTDTKNSIRIICDISMGGTNPKALRALGAPKNVNLKFLNGLHAKFYISDNGAVVGSANATANGVGFKAKAKHLESGIFVRTGNRVFSEIEAEFEKIWKEADILNGKSLDEADKNFLNAHPESKLVPDQSHKLSMDELIENPDAFGALGIVMTFSSISNEEHERMKTEQQEDQPKDSDTVYAGWGKQAKKFPEVCIWTHGTSQSKLPGGIRRIRGPFEDHENRTCLFAYNLDWPENIPAFCFNTIATDRRVLKLAKKLKEKGKGELYVSGKDFIEAVLRANK